MVPRKLVDRCMGCNQPSHTLFCDACAPDLSGRWADPIGSPLGLRHNGFNIAKDGHQIRQRGHFGTKIVTISA